MADEWNGIDSKKKRTG